MTLSSEDRETLIGVRLENAKDALRDAEVLRERGSLRGAVNRSYYAMFYASSAAAMRKGASFGKHTALISFFQKEFVRSGLIDKKHGRALQKAFEDRSEGDYQDYPKFTMDQVATRICEAGEFVAAVENFLK